MPIFNVTVRFEGFKEFKIRAETEEEAMDLAEEKFEDVDPYDVFDSIDEVTASDCEESVAKDNAKV